jgi:hypothetical protein
MAGVAGLIASVSTVPPLMPFRAGTQLAPPFTDL